MTTIDTSDLDYSHCNRCNGTTHHKNEGCCKKIDSGKLEDGSSIHFSETYTLQQCNVCGQAKLRLVLWNSENDESRPEYFPPRDGNPPPVWIEQHGETYKTILGEVYKAMNAGLNTIALMGIRAVLDIWVESNLAKSSYTKFLQKLEAIRDKGILGDQQVKQLYAAFDAGSAAAHRGFCPKTKDVETALEGIEIVLKQSLLAPKFDELKSNTPQRR